MEESAKGSADSVTQTPQTADKQPPFSVQTKHASVLQKTPVVFLLALLCCALWGSAFPCIKFGYEWLHIAQNDAASQLLFAGLRFMLAGCLTIVLFPLLTARRRILLPNRRAFSKIVILAMLQTFLQYLFFYIGLSHTTASKASVLNSLNVFVAVLAACLLFHQERLGLNKIVACVLGFAGVVLVNISGGGGMQISLLGEGFMLFAAVSYAFSSVVLKRFAQTQDPVMLSGWQFLLGGVLLCLVGVCAGGRIDFVSHVGVSNVGGSPLEAFVFALARWRGVWMLLYLALVSAVAYAVWGILLRENPVSRITVFGFLNPICGVVLSVLLRGEGDMLHWRNLIALCLVCAGIVLANINTDKTTKKKTHPL
ncbi:MAG: DMT family transporter [Clostridiales bacterium]|nr:DMT family transporter [Clostridiales bacterium]